MSIARLTICLATVCGIAACSDPPPPVSVSEFMENPRLLEATMVRCGQNRSEMKYESECVNARDAVNRLERAEERERKAHLDAQSERKRQQLRATQEAAAAARRRAEDEQRRREEAAYLGIFEESGDHVAPEQSSEGGNPAPEAPVAPETEPPDGVTPTDPGASADPSTDLSAIREELRRRQDVPQ